MRAAGMLNGLLNMTLESADLPYRPRWGHADATILIDKVTKTTRTRNEKAGKRDEMRLRISRIGDAHGAGRDEELIP
jgi:hypothetical protein